MTKMRKKDKGESFGSAYIIRPMVWFAFQFSKEARFVRKYQRSKR